MDLMLGRGAKFAGILIRTTSKFLPAISHESLLLSKPHVETKCSNLPQFYERSSYGSFASCAYLTDTNQKPSKVQGLLRRDVYHKSLGVNFSHTSKSFIDNKDCYPPPKPSIFQRMKQMTKDYWHILIPVHIVTSLGWVTIFYIASKNGVDVVSILERFDLGEKYVDMLRGSNAGHWAVTYALYKVFTPVRYTITVGGTTISIKYLNKWGYLKTKPSKQQIQSKACAEEHKTKYSKPSDMKETEPPKT